MSISRSKSRQFNQLEKQTKKKERKKIFFRSFLPKKGGVGCRLCARLVFFLDETQKTNPQEMEREEQKEEVLGPLLQKRRKNNSEFHRRRTQQRALENRNFTHHSLVLSSLSRSLHSFFRFLPSVPVMGAKFMNVFFLYFFFFCFFSFLRVVLHPPHPDPKKNSSSTSPPPFFLSLLSLGFCSFVLFLR